MAAQKSRRRKVSKRSTLGATLRLRFVAALCVCVALGELSPWIWLGVLSEQFRGYLLPPLWLLGAWALRDRAWTSVGAIAGVSLLIALPSLPLVRSVTSAPSQGPTLDVMTLGLDGMLPAPNDLARWLRSADADVIVLTASPEPPEHRARGRAGYESWTLGPVGGHNLTILSRLPVKDAPTRDPDEAVRATFLVEGCPVRLTALQLPSAYSAAHASPRKRLLAQLDSDREHEARVWIGDFGGDVRAAGLRELMARSRLDDSRLGFGINATWPLELGPLGVAMDHVLVGGWVAVRERDAQPLLPGAPRRPARAKLQLTSPRCERTH